MLKLKKLLRAAWITISNGIDQLNKERIFAYLVLILTIIFISSLVIWLNTSLNDNQNVATGHNPQSLGETWWMMFVTWATVGYGDFVPNNWFGKAIVIITILLATVITPMLSASITSFMITNKLKQAQGMGEVNFEDHIVICGWNRGGKTILDKLYIDRLKKQTNIVLVNSFDAETNQEIIEQYPKVKIQFVHGELTSRAVLHRANISKAKSVLLLADTTPEGINKTDEQVLLATLAIRDLAPKVWIAVDIIHASNRDHLMRAQANEIIITSTYNPFLLYSSVVSPGLVRFVDYLLSERDAPKLINKEIPKEFIGKPFSELLKHWYLVDHVILVGLLEHAKTVKIEDILSDDMTAIDQFIQEKFQAAGCLSSIRDEDIIPMINPNPKTELHANHVAIVLSPSFSEKVQW